MSKPISATGDGPGPQVLVEQFFLRNPGVEFATKEVADANGLSPQTVGLLASKLAVRGVLERAGKKFKLGKIQQMPKAG